MFVAPRPNLKRFALVVGLCLAFAPGAQGQPASYAQTQRALNIAFQFWGRMPSCGRPKVSWTELPAGAGAETTLMDGSCRIVFNSGEFSWPKTKRKANVSSSSEDWPTFCTLMAHGVGHLILGPDRYAITNPQDPAHSLNPRSVMYASVVHFIQPCVNTNTKGWISNGNHHKEDRNDR